MSLRYANREEAGRALAAELVARLAARPPEGPVVVLALPRGGVPVAAMVARALAAPLDLVLVRKIGVPWQPELAVAAVVDGGGAEIVIDERVRAMTGATEDEIRRRAQHEMREIERRRGLYLAGRAHVPVAGATVIVVDDGVATGTTVRAALKALRRQGPARVILAVPVGPVDTLAALGNECDEVVCLRQPEPFEAVGRHYADFHQVEDGEVLAFLAAARVPAADGERG